MIELSTITRKLKRSFGLYENLLQELEEGVLAKDLAGLPSNTLGQQLWCVIGARQSYSKAILHGEWQGFDCDLDWGSTGQKESVIQQLEKSRIEFLEMLERLEKLSEKQQSLLFDLIEHEAQHHGQIIRYLYALKVPVPAAWKSRYNLD